MLGVQVSRAQPFQLVVMDAQQLVNLGLPADVSAELTPCLARGLLEHGRPRTLHLTALGGCLENPTRASVVYTPKGTFSRMVLQRDKQKQS